MLAAPFIVGADASSTALLGASLDAHPVLAVVRNTRLTREFLRAADSSAAEGLRRSYASAAARRGKQRWGDETPEHVLVMRVLHRLLPEARFVHVVRDGREALAASRDGHREVPVDRATDASRAATHWRKCIVQARAQAPADACLELRYEDLLADPERVLRQVCRFLDLGYDARMLQPIVRAGPVQTGWRERLSDWDIRAFEHAAGRELHELGYSQVSPPARAAADAGSPEARRAFDRGVHLEKQGEFDRALACFAQAARLKPERAEYLGAHANLLERLGQFGEAWDGLARWARLTSPPTPDDWRGGPISGERVVLRRRIRHLAAEIRQARFIAALSRDAAACTVAADARLVNLLARSFPGASVIAEGEALPPGVRMSYEDAASMYGRTAQALRDGFVPLVPDVPQAQALRRAYRTDTRPLVGIAWASANTRKRLPALLDWRALLECDDLRFVSLQYGDIAADRAALDGVLAAPLIVDPAIDQMRDMDAFAAQVAAMDLVVCISCTAAHLAGALGVRTIVLFDEDDAQTWQHDADTSPWYPRLRIARRRAAEGWADAIGRARLMIERNEP